jgi:hypothetical protein
VSNNQLIIPSGFQKGEGWQGKSTYSIDRRPVLLDGTDLGEQLDDIHAKRSPRLPSKRRVEVEEELNGAEVVSSDGERRGLRGPSSSLTD